MDGSKHREKEKNPRENANILSVATFFYTLPTFIHGYKNDFEEDDLYETYSDQKSSILGNKIEKLWNKEMERAKNTNKRPSLGKVLFQCFGFDHMLVGLALLFNEIIVKTFQVLALGELVSFYLTRSDNSNINDAYFYAGKIVLLSLLSVLIGQPAMMSGAYIGIKMRVACCSLIYRKALKLNKLAFEKTTTGQMINLISNDVKNIIKFCEVLHFVWIAPIQTIFLSYFMYKEAGYSSFFGILLLVAFIPLHFYMGKIQSVYRTKSAYGTDERIRLMNEIIQGIPVIKMYTWEKPFAKLIALYRKLEMKAIRITAHLKGIYSAGFTVNARIAAFFTILAYVLINNEINAQQVFVLTGLYNTLRQTMVVFFPFGVSLIAEMNVYFKRMIDFLLLDEVHYVQCENIEDDSITIKDFSAKWSPKLDYTLSNLNLSIKPGCLTTFIGLVGSGKSSLLNAILRELPITEGDLFVKGEISYSSQEPWLFQETVQQNILFGSSLDLQHYKKVIKACALQNDFRQLPHSDSTIVGDRGTSLSGGQKARINLARAVYKEADIYLLDDPLSAVDTHVGKEIFDKCIKTFLKRKTVVLVTHQLQYLKDADHIVVLDNGSVIAQGTPLELQESGIDFARFLQEGSTDANDKYDEKERSESFGSKTSLNEKKVEAPVVAREQKATGSVSYSIYKEYLKAGANCLGFGGLLFVFLIVQVVTSGSDYFLAYWVNIEQDQEHNLESDRLRLVCLISYSCFILLLIFLSVIRSVVFVETCVKASINLHNDMFKNIIRATLRFFYLNPSGRILNRFSKDIGAIDELLPSSIIEPLTIMLMVVGIVAVISVVNAWLILPFLIIAVVSYFLRKFYMGTGRSIQRLDGVTKSPVIAHLNASLQGLATIRAAKAQKLLVKEFDNHQDLNTSASYVFLTTSRAFGYCLDLCCIVYITAVTFSTIFTSSENYGGNVGLMISQALTLTLEFQWGMRQIAELETHMTSVERVLEYNEIETEELYTKTQDVAKNWPKKAQIEFKNVSLRYFKDSEPVLRKITFKVEALQKIGIVGRTGAGKSSLINALFLTADVDGTILIDTVDTKNVSLHQLRSNISIIPQEPILFSGSMRKNLDPFDEFADKDIWEALERVELRDTVMNLISGLDAEISEGSNLSVGQRQLVCLARALLRNNKILVLDEATANVDHVTDALIQATIRKQFTHCTVLTIAHRLDTVIDCDKILVMDAGQVVEFDQPRVLLENTKGVFYGMVQETGKVMTVTLTDMAKNNAMH